MTRIFLVLLVLLVVLFGVGAYGSYRWQQDTNAAVAKLECCAVANPLTYDPDRELTGLPDPVARYFRRVLRPGQVMIRRARQTQVGEFRIREEGNWAALHATQTSIVNSPGFVWDARIALVPRLLDTEVRDSYSSGNAGMTAKVLGLVTMANARNAPELASSALQRHLGEAMWFPTALLPSQGVTWTPIDDHSARATLIDHQVTAVLDFRFDPNTGEMTGAYTATRFQEKNGKYLSMPWEATCSEYADRGGMRVPLQAEVAWIIDGKRVPYWRARIASIEYE